jgi:KipI family sensor histidine kinase inhibitor
VPATSASHAITAPSILALGECALLLSWPERIDAGTLAQVHACAARLRAAAPDWVEDIVPAWCSVAVVLDAACCVERGIGMQTARDWIKRVLQSVHDAPGAEAGDGRLVEIPVCYGGDDGPDLAQVAATAGLDPASVVARHSAVEYRVGMLGFAPGFPYLLGLDPTLHTPRRARPRSSVPAGSVGIGGAQTGIYPHAGPGGWQLIGRTRLKLFDPLQDPPSLLAPGDRVRFVEASSTTSRALPGSAR